MIQQGQQEAQRIDYSPFVQEQVYLESYKLWLESINFIMWKSYLNLEFMDHFTAFK